MAARNRANSHVWSQLLSRRVNSTFRALAFRLLSTRSAIALARSFFPKLHPDVMSERAFGDPMS